MVSWKIDTGWRGINITTIYAHSLLTASFLRSMDDPMGVKLQWILFAWSNLNFRIWLSKINVARPGCSLLLLLLLFFVPFICVAVALCRCADNCTKANHITLNYQLREKPAGSEMNGWNSNLWTEIERTRFSHSRHAFGKYVVEELW